MYQFSVPYLESAFRLDIDQVVITGQATVQQGDGTAARVGDIQHG